MDDRQQARTKLVSAVARICIGRICALHSANTIKRIAEKRRPSSGKVDANLMRATSHKIDFPDYTVIKAFDKLYTAQ